MTNPVLALLALLVVLNMIPSAADRERGDRWREWADECDKKGQSHD